MNLSAIKQTNLYGLEKILMSLVNYIIKENYQTKYCYQDRRALVNQHYVII